MGINNESNGALRASWTSAVLEATSIGYAVFDVEEAGLVWRNTAFEHAAAEAGSGPADFVKRLIDSGHPSVPFQEDSASAGCLRLIEVLPVHLDQTKASRVARDAVTGVLDRSAVLGILREWCLSHRERPFALVFLDLDDFKRINDEQGHLVGDRSLRSVGDCLKGLVRGGDVVGRFGGDEFLILLQGVKDAGVFHPIEQRIAKAFSEDLSASAELGSVGASFGVAYSLEFGGDSDRLIEAADQRMYAAKRAKLSAE